MAAADLPSGYLLDTSVVSARGEPRHKLHPKVRNFFDAGPGSMGVPVLFSPINVTEISFGMHLAIERLGAAWPELVQLVSTVRSNARVEINETTADIHAAIRARIAIRFMPAKVKEAQKLGEVETWQDQFTNSKLQVQEGDLWLAALAVQSTTTIVTCDKLFVRHREITHPGLSVHVIE